MPFGLFGKLPQKRDFISFGIPQDVLNPLETWLQSAIAASRAELGRDWERLYLVAPIWRFWIGPAIFGRGCAGAIMSSVDGVGRYFPLLALYACADGEQIPPPPFAPQGGWYGEVEARLLSTLDSDRTIAIDALLSEAPAPSLEPAAAPTTEEFKGGFIWRGKPNTGAAALLTGVVEADYRHASKVRSYWWTAGGGQGDGAPGPLLYTKEGLPDPYFYTLMLKSVAD